MAVIAEIVLPARRAFDLRATVRRSGCGDVAPFAWQDGRHPRLRWAEQLANGSVYLLEVRPGTGDVVLRATGRGASEIEQLAPLTARVRRALGLDVDPRRASRYPTLRGTSVFEDCVKAVAAADTPRDAAVQAINAVGRLGPRCPASRRLRAFPGPRTLVHFGVRGLRARTPIGDRAPLVLALARASIAGSLDLPALDTVALRPEEIVRLLAQRLGVRAWRPGPRRRGLRT